MIRRATREDIPNVLLLIHEFQDESLDAYKLFCDDDKAIKLMESVWQTSLVMEEDGKIVGVIAGIIVSAMVSIGYTMQEIIYFVTKSYRGKGISLLTAFEHMSREMGCQNIVMVHMGNIYRNAMERIYTNLGYVFLEAQYIKCLT